MKKNTIPAIVGISLLIVLILRYSYHNSRPQNMIDDIRKVSVPMFDSLSKKMRADDVFDSMFTSLLERKQFDRARQLLDSGYNTNNGQDSYHMYKGEIYAGEKKFVQAIEEYDFLIVTHQSSSPLAFALRAYAYLQLQKNEEALQDFKNAASTNFDYFYQLAYTYEYLRQKDSALKYYLIFQEHYPDDGAVQKKILNWKNNQPPVATPVPVAAGFLDASIVFSGL